MTFRVEKEFYFGLMLGIGYSGGTLVICLPFVVIEISKF